MPRNKKHIKGDVAELIAAEFFLNKGYYVFRNMSQHGPADLTVLDDDGNIDSYGNVTVIPNSVIKEIQIKK